MKQILMGVVMAASIGASAAASDLRSLKIAPDAGWTFLADTVMGGVSKGQAEVITETETYLRLTGTVSTANNGGFIQVRQKLSEPPAQQRTGVRLVVRGNGETYYVHLRSRSTRLPWQYYQAPFETIADWTEVQLPFEAFEASGRLMRGSPGVDTIKSVGIVAFGKDHEALVEVREVGFY